MSAQIRYVATDEGALWTFVRFPARQMFHHLFPEVSEKMNAFVSSFVDAGLKLLAAQLATVGQKIIENLVR